MDINNGEWLVSLSHSSFEYRNLCVELNKTKPGSMRGKDLCRVILLDDGFGFIRFTSKGR